jgi:hypothetical protein
MVTCSSRGTRAGRGSCRRQQQALDEHLPDQAQSRRAERCAYRHLTGPGGRAREQQAGDVETRRDQDEGDRAKQHIESRSVVAQHVIEQGNRCGQPPAIGGHVLLAEPRTDRRQLPKRLRVIDAGLKPRDRFHEVRAPAVLRQVPLQPQPDIHILRESEGRRHHANDRVLTAVHLERPTDNR